MCLLLCHRAPSVRERYDQAMDTVKRTANTNTRPAFARWLDDTNDVTRMFLAAGQIPDIINLAGGLPEPSVYPAEKLADFASKAIIEFGNDALNYGPIEGLPALRDQIAQRFCVKGMHFSRDNVLITTGGMQGLDLIGKALLDDGALIAAQSPAYLGALDAWRPRRPHYRPFFPDRENFDAVTALDGAQFAYTVPNFSNPTGRLIEHKTRQSIVAAAHTTGTWLVEDDPYGTLYYDAQPLPHMLTISASTTAGTYSGPVVYMGTVSKELAPGLRIGWILASPEMIKVLTTAKQGSDMCSSGLSQLVTLQAMKAGLLEKIRPQILDIYRQRRDALCAAMSQHLSNWFDWEVPVGGMFVWVVAKDKSMDTDRLAEVALQSGVCVSPSSVFDPEGSYRNALRINFTFNPPDKLAEGIQRLASATQILISQSRAQLSADQ